MAFLRFSRVFQEFFCGFPESYLRFSGISLRFPGFSGFLGAIVPGRADFKLPGTIIVYITRKNCHIRADFPVIVPGASGFAMRDTISSLFVYLESTFSVFQVQFHLGLL